MDFTLRPWQSTDVQSLAKHANNENIAKFLTDMFPHPYGLEDAINYIKMVSSDNPTKVFAIDVNGEAVGSIGVFPQSDIFRKNTEMGYWLSESFWGNGIMTQAIRQMTHYGFETFPIHRIFARPFGTNKKSQRVLEKAGFQLEARIEKIIFKNGNYDDELIFAIRKE